MAPTNKKIYEGSPEEELLNVPYLLQVKRDGNELSEQQIRSFVNSVCDGSIEDVQLGAFLMSVYLNGMNKAETSALTKSMRDSGTVFEWPSSWIMVDKHSTGGVGDKISLILAPALATKGLKVPMISGRGLAHTGGTLDKLESIPGFRVSLTEEEMKKTLSDVGCCIVGQTASLVPADKRMYAVRDVTATVPSIPLIVSSIISKKACESLHSLVLDVKFGSGSFMKTQKEAETLAEALVDAGDSLGIKTSALVTSMEFPIGRKIGNALEVEEAIECLRGEGPEELMDLVLSLGAELLLNTRKAKTLAEAKTLLNEALRDGSALNKFSDMIVAQGVDPKLSEKICKEPKNNFLPKSKFSTNLFSPSSGIINAIDAMVVAEVCLSLGAGRVRTTDQINYAVGIVLLKSVGDEIKEGEPWAEIRHDDILEESIKKKAESSLTVSNVRNKKASLVVKRIARE